MTREQLDTYIKLREEISNKVDKLFASLCTSKEWLCCYSLTGWTIEDGEIELEVTHNYEDYTYYQFPVSNLIDEEKANNE